jgi:hypothetical protein
MDEDQRILACNLIDDELAELSDENLQFLASIVGQMKNQRTMFYDLPETTVANIMIHSIQWKINLRDYDGALSEVDTLVDFLKSGDKATIAERMLKELSR